MDKLKPNRERPSLSLPETSVGKLDLLAGERKSKSKRGRPKLDESERRQKLHLIYLTSAELESLRKEHDGPSSQFGPFLRQKLLATRALIVPRSIDPDVRIEIQNLLKLTGSINLIALRTKGDIEVSDEFRKMTSLIQGIVVKTKYSINESVDLMAIAPKLVTSLTNLLQAVDNVEHDLSSTDLLRSGIRDMLLFLEPLMKKFER